jgi:2-iminobutanoate/2-iminopropanoate deaminase
MFQRLSSSQLAAPKFLYSPCIRNGPMGLVSGMVGIDPATGLLVEGGMAEQTQRIFDNLRLALPDYGFAWQDLAHARAYLTDFTQFDAFNAVWSRQFTPGAAPARTSVGAQALPLGALVEIEFVFLCGDAQ